ncbi:hypothetical protein F8M41_015785 [Gigaspora margarita]|uniref:Uncharacterized protein n=1 Tax=Gigaspora margarita TaxID=4874 RepID=A0A8H4AQ78_GIGMA|nr:hypothetical protein F8M41_015785 [Gigaspora margarita]
MITIQEKFCLPLLEKVSEIEKEYGVKTYALEQTRFNSLIQCEEMLGLLQIDFTTCQLSNQTGVSANSRLPITTVFKNISDPVNSPVLQNFNIVYNQIHTIKCSDYEFYNIKTNFLRNKNKLDKPKPILPISPPEDNNRPNNNDENNRPNDNNNNNNTSTSTTTSNTLITTIPSTSTTNISTTRTKSTTTFTFSDIPSH